MAVGTDLGGWVGAGTRVAGGISVRNWTACAFMVPSKPGAPVGIGWIPQPQANDTNAIPTASNRVLSSFNYYLPEVMIHPMSSDGAVVVSAIE